MNPRNPDQTWHQWYNQVTDGYTLEQRRNWYSPVAEAYYRTRPRYPQALIQPAIALLPTNAKILEVGCGPGIATIEFAQQGFEMVCVEPSEGACAIARQLCAPFPQVEICNTTFEDWALPAPESFDAVLAATSFHWISPEVGYAKAAQALKPQAPLILLWNVPPQPDYDLYQALHPVYAAHAPELAGFEAQDTQAENIRKFGQAVLDSGRFENLNSQQVVTETTYTVDDYLMMLGTLSPYIRLEEKTRSHLFDALRAVLEPLCGQRLPVSYLSILQIAQKR